MKFIITTCLTLLIVSSAYASGLRAVLRDSAVSKIFQNEVATSYLSKSLGLTRAEVMALGREQLTQKLESTLSAQEQNKLIEQLKGMEQTQFSSQAITKGFKSLEGNDLKSFLSTSKYRPSEIASDVLRALAPRVQNGELEPGLIKKAIGLMDRVGQRLGTSVLGAGAANCVKNYSATAVKNFAELGMAFENTMPKLNQVTDVLTAKAKSVFGVTEANANKRVCALSGIGAKCQVFGPAVAMNCK